MAASRGAPSLGWTCGVARGPHARLLCGAPRGARRGVGQRTWGVEGRGAHQAPHVGEPAVVAKPREHLGRTVALAAAHLLERRAHDRAARVEIGGARRLGPARIPSPVASPSPAARGRGSARVGAAEQHVLELKIAVHDPLLVEVAHGAHHLAEVAHRGLLLQLALRDDEAEELTPLGAQVGGRREG
eukprot:scaffold47240_cov63-Phaeocystis_antarctica.AAC.1